MRYEYLSDEEMNRYYKEVLRQMHTAQYLPDVIVCPMRGGVDMGIKLSNYLEVPVKALHWQTRDGEETNVNQLLEIVEQNIGKNILIVDDICDTGKTLVDIYTYLAEGDGTNYNVSFATAINNVECDFQPTWCGREISRSDDTQWFVFPWEKWWQH